jgi:hypothetical protein
MSQQTYICSVHKYPGTCLWKRRKSRTGLALTGCKTLLLSHGRWLQNIAVLPVRYAWLHTSNSKQKQAIVSRLSHLLHGNTLGRVTEMIPLGQLWQQTVIPDVVILLQVPLDTVSAGAPARANSNHLELRQFPGHSQIMSLSPFFAKQASALQKTHFSRRPSIAVTLPEPSYEPMNQQHWQNCRGCTKSSPGPSCWQT